MSQYSPSQPAGMDVRDRRLTSSDVRQTDVRQHHRLMPPPRRRGHNNPKLMLSIAFSSLKVPQKYVGGRGSARAPPDDGETSASVVNRRRAL